MHVDFKTTIWERVEIPKEHEEEILEKIKDGTITSANTLFNYQPKDGKGYLDLDCEKLGDTSEQMTVEENGGCSTIEVWEDNIDGPGMSTTFENGNEE